jgi:ABC-type dipeptide/oligopeptide/nickel transport system ATPase subunit
MPPENSCAVGTRTLGVEYRRRKRILLQDAPVPVLKAINLLVPHGVTWGLTGASGCGKSTLARCLARWEPPTSGTVFGEAAVQLIMQDPGASLNPRFAAKEVIEEPLVIARRLSKDLARNLMAMTGLDPAWSARPAAQFSGGQRARLAIARAIAAIPESGPGMLIFDESFASLDYESISRILDLLGELQSRLRLTYLIVSHELELLGRIVERVIVMSEGRIAGIEPISRRL